VTARGVVAALCASLALACGPQKDETAAKELGQQTADITADTQILREGNAAVNEVIRNATDCAVARPAITAADAKLDELAGRVRTATGRQTLEGLRSQVAKVKELCP
jgi:hypothetical protein